MTMANGLDRSARPVGRLSPEEAEALRARRLFMENAVVEGGDYSGRDLVDFVSAGSRFVDCKFESMKLGDAVWGAGGPPAYSQSVYVGCSFDKIRIRGMHGGWARFERCSFRDVVISGWNYQVADVVECVFTGTMKSNRGGGAFWGSPLSDYQDRYQKRVNEFWGNDFSGCKLVGMDFRRGVDLRLQVLPSGPDYVYVEDGLAAVDRALTVIESWSDEEQRRSAQSYLGICRKDLLDMQKQLFMTRPTGKRLAPIWPQLREALLGA